MNLITCKNISFVYDGVPAVKDLDFSVEPNDYLCIVGENGAGKSTLVKGLLRLKKPASGTIPVSYTHLDVYKRQMYYSGVI